MKAMAGGLVGITIVTFNSEAVIRRCLESVLSQDYPHIEVVAIDNASGDRTREILRDFETRVRVVFNRENAGFAAGQNQAISISEGEWILTLNPDTYLPSNFLSMLMAAASVDDAVGTVCGKLLSMARDFTVPEKAVIDSTGIYMTPNMRHFDRGNGEQDRGQYEQLEYVFGATAAAALYRRRMISDISIGVEFFDHDFFAYREDADVAWRAQLLGWKCLYVPGAIAYHIRTVLPTNRRSVSAAINMHSVKNRFLMRIKNVTGDLYRRYGLRMTARDLVVIAGCLLREWRSLPAFPMLLRLLPRSWRKRREIMRRRRASDESIRQWFADTPVSFPIPGMAAALLNESRMTDAHNGPQTPCAL